MLWGGEICPDRESGILLKNDFRPDRGPAALVKISTKSVRILPRAPPRVLHFGLRVSAFSDFLLNHVLDKGT